MTNEQKHLTLRELKDKGHKLLSQVAKKRKVHVDFVYHDLQKALGKTLEESAHFSKMYTVREVESAIAVLEEWTKKKKHKSILPQAEMVAAIRQLPKPKVFGFWIPKLYWKRVTLFTLAPKKITQQ